MTMSPPTVFFPEPNTYVRFWDPDKKATQFEELLTRNYPYNYPRRLQSVSPGGKTGQIQFKEINPSKTKNHRYLAYLGLHPGALYYLYHPYNYKTLKWDEAMVIVADDLTGMIMSQQSPYGSPRKAIWITPDRWPAIEALNITNQTIVPEVIFVAARYLVRPHAEIPMAVVDQLQRGIIPSYSVDAGGEW